MGQRPSFDCWRVDRQALPERLIVGVSHLVPYVAPLSAEQSSTGGTVAALMLNDGLNFPHITVYIEKPEFTWVIVVAVPDVLVISIRNNRNSSGISMNVGVLAATTRPVIGIVRSRHTVPLVAIPP